MLAALAGCSASDRPDAQLARAPADGLEIDVDPFRVLNVMVVAAEDGNDGLLTMTIANRGDERDALTAVEVDESNVEFSGPQALPANGAVAFGAGRGPVVTVRDLKARAGEAVRVALTFRNIGTVRFRTVVVPATGEYESITPSPEATPALEPTLEATPGASPEDTADAGPGATASPPTS